MPFFVPTRWFTFVDPVFTWLGLLDAVGNAVMLALWVVGWRRAEAVSAAN